MWWSRWSRGGCKCIIVTDGVSGVQEIRSMARVSAKRFAETQRHGYDIVTNERFSGVNARRVLPNRGSTQQVRFCRSRQGFVCLTPSLPPPCCRRCLRTDCVAAHGIRSRWQAAVVRECVMPPRGCCTCRVSGGAHTQCPSCPCVHARACVCVFAPVFQATRGHSTLLRS